MTKVLSCSCESEYQDHHYGSFYMVWVEGKPAPILQHTRKEEAEKEAVRLAGKEGKTVYVLQAIEAYRTPFPRVEKISLG